MVKINRTYLDPALSAVNSHTDALFEKYKAQQHAVHSASQAVADDARARLFWRSNTSRGIMISSILIGIGVMAALIIAALPGLVRAFKDSSALIIQSSTLAQSAPEIALTNGTDAQGFSPTSSLGVTDTSEASIPAVIVPSHSRDTSSAQCFNNGSFDAPCSDTIMLPNGATFSGTWMDGSANGEGLISFNDGGTISGVWAAGTLTNILGVTAPEISSAITKSVTYFSGTSGSEVNPLFEEVTAGHIFNSPKDPTWSSAYCYVIVFDGTNSIQVSLSNIPNINAQVSLRNYTQNSRFTREEFEAAQERCRYQYTNF